MTNVARYMTDAEIDQLEEQVVTALSDGDHCVTVDVLCRGLIRTLHELKQRRTATAANDDGVKTVVFAQLA